VALSKWFRDGLRRSVLYAGTTCWRVRLARRCRNVLPRFLVPAIGNGGRQSCTLTLTRWWTCTTTVDRTTQRSLVIAGTPRACPDLRPYEAHEQGVRLICSVSPDRKARDQRRACHHLVPGRFERHPFRATGVSPIRRTFMRVHGARVEKPGINFDGRWAPVAWARPFALAFGTARVRWDSSSPGLQAGGRGFESHRLHCSAWFAA
jgi:hypothetical protein